MSQNKQLQKRQTGQLQGDDVDSLFNNALQNLSEAQKQKIHEKIVDCAVDIKTEQIRAESQSNIAQKDIDNFIGNMGAFEESAGSRFTHIRQEGNFKTGSGKINIKAQKGSPFCFVATEIYGSQNSEEVWLLRKFRDNYLINSKAGQRFVDFYYKHGEHFAGLIRKYSFLRKPIELILKILLVAIKYINRSR